MSLRKVAKKIDEDKPNPIPRNCYSIKLPKRLYVHERFQIRFIYGESLDLSPVLRKMLDAGDGEIRITKIPKKVCAEQIAAIASYSGKMYKLRFMQTTKGKSSGTAFLQYVKSDPKKHSPLRLSKLFCHFNLPMLQFYRSKKPIKIQLTNVAVATRIAYTLLDMYTDYDCIDQVPSYNGHPVYILDFDTSGKALNAFETLSEYIFQFGPNCDIQWVTVPRYWPKPIRCNKKNTFGKRAGMRTYYRSKWETEPMEENVETGATNQPDQEAMDVGNSSWSWGFAMPFDKEMRELQKTMN